MGNIRLSEKHGVNPVLITCFWCGGDTNALALLGRLPGDAEAPRKAAMNYDPCDKCKELWKQGVVLIEVDSRPKHAGQPPLGGPDSPHYPTGSHAVIKADAIRRVITPKILAEQAISRGMAIMETAAYQAIIHPRRGHTEDVPSGEKHELSPAQSDPAGHIDGAGIGGADDSATGAAAAPERGGEESVQQPAARPQQQSGEARAPEAGQETEAPAAPTGPAE